MSALIAGVDVSSRVLAIVLLDANTGALRETLELKIGGKKGSEPGMAQSSAFRLAAETLSWASVAYAENPMGAQPLAIALCNRALGALIHAMGDQCPETRIVILEPAKWKKDSGLKGNAPKSVIADRALAHYPQLAGPGFSQDICDAAMIARAGWHDHTGASRLAEHA